MKKSLEIALLALFLFAFELFVYSFTKMSRAAGTGTPASFIVYSFQWLMALTVAIGLAFPAGALIGKKSGRESAGLIFILSFLFVFMTCFSAVSFLRAPVTKPSSAAEKTTKDVSEFVEYVDSEVKETSPETLGIGLKFKNKAKQDITELDYVLVVLEEAHVFYKIKIRQGVYLPAGGEGATRLTWDRARLKKPDLFDTLKRAYENKTLKVYAKAARIRFLDGSVIEG